MMKRDLPYELFGWCLLVLVAAFMPWASNSFGFPFGGSVSAIATGWSGSLNLIFILIPNWLGVLLAAALAALGWLRANEVLFDPQLSVKLAWAGAIHAGVFIAWALIGGRPPVIGLGSIATLAAFVAIIRWQKSSAVAPYDLGENSVEEVH